MAWNEKGVRYTAPTATPRRRRFRRAVATLGCWTVELQYAGAARRPGARVRKWDGLKTLEAISSGGRRTGRRSRPARPQRPLRAAIHHSNEEEHGIDDRLADEAAAWRMALIAGDRAARHERLYVQPCRAAARLIMLEVTWPQLPASGSSSGCFEFRSGQTLAELSAHRYRYWPSRLVFRAGQATCTMAPEAWIRDRQEDRLSATRCCP